MILTLSNVISSFMFLKKPVLGDVYSFNPEDWVPYDEKKQQNMSSKVQYKVVDIDQTTLCNLQKKYTYFPDRYKFQEGTELCRRFGGRKVDVSSKEQVAAVSNFLYSILDDPAFSETSWVSTGTMFTDEDVTNVWVNHETGNLPKDKFSWFFGEPNGGNVENCAELWGKAEADGRKTNGFNDIACSRPVQTACEDVGLVKILLRGHFSLTHLRKDSISLFLRSL